MQYETLSPKYSFARSPEATAFVPQKSASKLVKPVVSNQLADTPTFAYLYIDGICSYGTSDT